MLVHMAETRNSPASTQVTRAAPVLATFNPLFEGGGEKKRQEKFLRQWLGSGRRVKAIGSSPGESESERGASSSEVDSPSRRGARGHWRLGRAARLRAAPGCAATAGRGPQAGPGTPLAPARVTVAPRHPGGSPAGAVRGIHAACRFLAASVDVCTRVPRRGGGSGGQTRR